MALTTYILPEAGAMSMDMSVCRKYQVADVETTDQPTSGMIVGDMCFCKDTNKMWKATSPTTWADVAGAGAGEANTASNVGAAGVGVYDGKAGVDLRFRKLNPGSTKITVTLNGQQIDVDADANAIVAASTDSRLSDARTPLSHGHSKADISTLGQWPIGDIPTGTSSSTVCIGNDPRLSDARTPTAHTHPKSEVEDAGTWGTAEMGTGTADATTFLRGDRTWATPPGGSSADPPQGTYAPGSFTILTGKYALMSKRLTLTGTQRLTAQGTARLHIT